MKLDTRYRQNQEIVSREIAGETILVPIRQNVGDLENIYTLNETATRIWALLDGQHTIAEIQVLIADEFEVDKAEADQDVLDFVSQLVAVDAVDPV